MEAAKTNYDDTPLISDRDAAWLEKRGPWFHWALAVLAGGNFAALVGVLL